MKDDDFKLLRGFYDERTNGRTTFVNVESLSRLKISFLKLTVPCNCDAKRTFCFSS